MKQKIKKLHEYNVSLEASYQCYEEATITVEAENSEQAEEIATQKMKDLNSLQMQLDIEELHDQDEQKNARAS